MQVRDSEVLLPTLESVISAALQLGAASVPGWDSAEERLAAQTPVVRLPTAELRYLIKAGADPLGDAYARLRSPDERRPLGQTYTPPVIVSSMVGWAGATTTPERVVDPGCGSGRFVVAAGRRFPNATLLAADIDPVATLMTRGTLAAAGLADRATVMRQDFRRLSPAPIGGVTLYIGNPPYVRHHQIEPSWKRWLVTTANRRGLNASALAGLHVHFFLATLEQAAPGDVGAFITSAEWLDVNYGALVRRLLLDGLGGLGVDVLDPAALPFTDATTTGVITTFRLGSRRESMRLLAVKEPAALGVLDGGQSVSRDRLAEAPRWTPLIRTAPKLQPGWIELGELCRVHRGAVTGANGIWVSRDRDLDLPEEVLFRSVTKARELFAAGDELASAEQLRYVIDLPPDLDVFDAGTRKRIERFLRRVRQRGAADGYIARNRRAWWSVGLREPAPILATYMARRPPAFVRNPVGARHINIAHGLYPRQPLSPDVLDGLAAALRRSVVVEQGRTYAGGLTKFEPHEMERLPVPNVDLLAMGR